MYDTNGFINKQSSHELASLSSAAVKLFKDQILDLICKRHFVPP